MKDFLPFIVIGLATGSIYGLSATGLVLTYRTSGIFNFAHAYTGVLSATVFFVLDDNHHLPWWLCLFISVGVLGPLMGLAWERVARRLVDANAAYKVIATVGMVSALSYVALLLRRLDNRAVGKSESTLGSIAVSPWLPSGVVKIAGVYISWGQIVIFGLGVGTTAGLWAILRFTRTGTAMRAVVDNPTLLDLIGTSPTRVRQKSWILGSCFAALSGVLFLATIGLTTALGNLVYIGMGAAALGAFANIPMAYVGGLVLGLAEALGQKQFSTNGGLIANVPASLPVFFLFALLLLVPKRRLAEAWKPLPRRRTARRTFSRKVQVLAGAALGIALLLPPILQTFPQGWNRFLCYTLLFLSLGMLVKTSGQISLAHLVFAAIGAASLHNFAASAGLPWPVAFLLSGLMAVPFGAVIAIPAVRLSGIFLAMATYAFAVAFDRFVYRADWMFTTVATSGVKVPRPSGFQSDKAWYYLTLAIVLAAVGVIVLLTRSRLGRLLGSLAESPRALETQGVSVNVTRVLLFCISAFFAGLAGALLGATKVFAGPVDFPSSFGLQMLPLVLIAPGGPLISALIAGLGWAVLRFDVDLGELNVAAALLFGLYALRKAMTAYDDDTKEGSRIIPLKVRRSLTWTLLAAQKRWVRLLVIAIVPSFVLQFQLANLTRGLVDVGIVAQAAPLSDYLVPLINTAFLVLVFGTIGALVTQRISYQVEVDLRTRVYAAVQSAAVTRLDAVASGQLMTRTMTDLTMVQRILGIAPALLSLLPVVLGVSIYLMFINPIFGILSLSAVPFNVWILRRSRRRMWSLSWAELNERAEVTAAIDEPVRGIRVVRAFGREDLEREHVDARSLRAYRFAMTRWRLLARLDILLKLSPVVAQAALLFLGAQLAAGGEVSVGTFLLAFQVGAGITGLAGIFDELWSAWQYLRSAQDRLTELVDMARAEEAATPVPPPPPGDGLQVTDLRLALAGRPVLQGVDVIARPGELVAVHGAPGSGKSTLAGSLVGLVMPDSGTIALDGVDTRVWEPDALRRAIRVVAEEPFLFATTVRENLELATPGEVDEATLRAALETAGADFVDDLPGGLDSEIGDRGLTLSGGQRQRLALARALVDPPRVLVLDDALSAVNPSFELEILRRIQTFAPRTAVVCISRRAGAATAADRLVELADPVDAPVVHTDGAVAVAEATDLQSAVASLVLTTESPTVQRSDIESDVAARPRDALRPFKAIAWLALGALVVQTVAKLAPEVAFGAVTNAIDEGNGARAIAPTAVLLLAGGIAAGMAYYFRVLSQQLTQGVMYLLRRRVFSRLSKLGIDYYDREMPGQVATRVVNDLDVLSTFLQGTGFRLLTLGGTLIVGMGTIAVLAPAAAPVVLALGLATLLLAVVQLPLSGKAYIAARLHLGDLMSRFEEDFTARHDIRSFGATKKRRAAFDAQALRLRSARRRAALYMAVFTDLFQFTGQLTSALVLYRSGNLVLAGSMSVGTALTVRLIANTAVQPLQQIGAAYSELLNVRASWRRLKEPYDIPILPTIDPSAQTCPPLVGEVVFDDVQFAYPHTGRQVLHGVSFRVPPTGVAALVGFTGAGKSSIAKLLSRMYDPTNGVVRIDGLDLRTIDLEGYRRQVGVVPQEAFLFRGTVGSNIGYGRPGATADEIEAAARAVGAHDVLSSLGAGYDSVVTEEGSNLTAAQRQLIALARAWIARPGLLILDEATSCLDMLLEQRVLDAVSALGVTTLMITHRESVVAAASHVIVLDEGRVVEEGTHDALVGVGGAYDRLWVAAATAQELA